MKYSRWPSCTPLESERGTHWCSHLGQRARTWWSSVVRATCTMAGSTLMMLSLKGRLAFSTMPRISSVAAWRTQDAGRDRRHSRGSSYASWWGALQQPSQHTPQGHSRTHLHDAWCVRRPRFHDGLEGRQAARRHCGHASRVGHHGCQGVGHQRACAHSHTDRPGNAKTRTHTHGHALRTAHTRGQLAGTRTHALTNTPTPGRGWRSHRHVEWHPRLSKHPIGQALPGRGWRSHRHVE
jgi:hypothetical protein